LAAFRHSKGWIAWRIGWKAFAPDQNVLQALDSALLMLHLPSHRHALDFDWRLSFPSSLPVC